MSGAGLLLLLVLPASAAPHPASDLEFINQAAEVLARTAGARAEALAVSLEEQAVLDAAKRVAAQIRPEPEFAGLFTQKFLDALARKVGDPGAFIRETLSAEHAEFGPVVAVELLERKGLSGEAVIRFDRGYTKRLSLALRSLDDPRLDGLILHSPGGDWGSAEAVLAELRRLKGTAALQLLRLDGGARPVLEHRPDTALAIGSVFKLYILQVLAERGLWDREVELRDALKAWPSGEMQDLPAGTRLPARQYAEKMIAISDNTATDHLLDLVGRAAVEAALARLGNTQGARNLPFLAANEMFKLKSTEGLLDRWRGLDLPGRRALVEGLKDVPLGDVREFWPRWKVGPIGIEDAEWFASPADICRLLGGMEESGDPEVLRILALNPGLEFPEEDYAWAGFKGGGEPGVIFHAHLFKTKAGGTYCLAAGQNDPAALAERGRFTALLQALVRLLPRAGAWPA